MKEKPRMTLAEMAAKSAGCNGRLLCPKCGCADFRTYKTIQGQPSTFRYKQCRHCGHKLMTIQSPEQAIRNVAEEDEIEDDDSSVV